MLRVLAVLAIALTPALACAHDAGHPELNGWMKGLHSGKGACCSGSDATVLTDTDWESLNGHYRVRIDNQWVDVPDDAVITSPNMDGRTLVWPINTWVQGVNIPVIRCFMPGSMT